MAHLNGPADFSQRARAIADGERAALAALAQVRERIGQVQAQRAAILAPRPPPEPEPVACDRAWMQALNPFRGRDDCAGAAAGATGPG